jgi:hypothetical protein
MFTSIILKYYLIFTANFLFLDAVRYKCIVDLYHCHSVIFVNMTINTITTFIINMTERLSLSKVFCMQLESKLNKISLPTDLVILTSCWNMFKKYLTCKELKLDDLITLF